MVAIEGSVRLHWVGGQIMVDETGDLLLEVVGTDQARAQMTRDLVLGME
jgi:hypothetical protein